MTTSDQVATKTTDYLHIYAWGRYVGSFIPYILREQKTALAENAPVNAIHRNQDGTWATADELSGNIKAHIEADVEYMRHYKKK